MLLKYFVRPVFHMLYLSPKKGSTTSVAGAVGCLPDSAMYLQPYWMPYHTSALTNNKSSRVAYPCPFPLFEMLGIYIGHAVTRPRLPIDGGKMSGEALWCACEEIIRTRTSTDR